MCFLHDWKLKPRWVLLFAGVLLSVSGCNNQDSSVNALYNASSPCVTLATSTTNAKFTDRKIVKDFADKVVIPTNQLLWQ